MISTKRLLSIFATGLVYAATNCVVLSQESDNDKLFPKSGATQTGKIVEMTRDNVVMEIRGNKQNFPATDILRIVYDEEPPKFSTAKQQAAAEQWDQALESLKAIDAKSIEREEVKKDLLYYQGLITGRLALRGQGDPVASKKRLMEYAKGNAQSYHFYEVAEMLGALTVSLGNNEEAAKFFDMMKNASSPDIKLHGRYLFGSVLLAQGKSEEARKAFAEAIAMSADSVDAKRYQKMSKVAINRCDVAEDKAPAAIESLRKMVDDSDATDSELFAGIYNALGIAHQKSGKNEEAVLDFLHTDLLFSTDPEMHAEALYHLSQLFGSIGDPQRAADAKSRLQSRYANSPWAKK